MMFEKKYNIHYASYDFIEEPFTTVLPAKLRCLAVQTRVWHSNEDSLISLKNGTTTLGNK
jgi:hypothetical protein